MKIYVNLYQTQNPDGWAASIARAYVPKGSKNEIAQGESIIYPNKEAAWNSVQKDAKKLDSIVMKFTLIIRRSMITMI